MHSSKDYLSSELNDSTSPNENSSFQPLQVTTQQMRQVILGSENHNGNFQQQSSNDFLGTVPATSASDESKPQTSSGSTASSIPVISNTNIDINSTLCTLLQQNQMLINRLLELDRDNAPKRSETPFPTNPDGFYVMPDFHNTIQNFSGIESRTQARDWLQSVQSVARLHHWPEAFKLEIVRTRLVGAASNWLCGRNFNTWSDFEKQFVSTFSNSSTSLVECMKSLLSRIQNKNESSVEYFHDKSRMCREVNLSFAETKQQIIEGLHCRDLCFYLLARDHSDEDSLLIDILSFTTMTSARNAHFKTDPQPPLNTPVRQPTQKPQIVKTSVSKFSTSKQPPSASPIVSVTRCYNCSSYGHYASSCTKPKREPGSCFKCGSTSHQLRGCPSAGTNNKEDVALVQSPSENVNSAYTIKLDIKFPSNEIVNVLAIVDTGSPVSLLRKNIVPLWSPPQVPPTLSSGLVGINGSELIVLDQMFVDILPPNDDHPINVNINIVPDSTIKCDLLLGRNFLSHPRVVLTINSGSFEIDFKRSDIVPFDEILSIESSQDYKSNELNLNIEETLPCHVKSEIENIVASFYLNNSSPPSELITCDPPELKIELKDSSIFHFNPRRLSFFEKDKLQLILDDLLARKIIEPCRSEFSSPIVLVKKKNGELRLCVDYRELNKLMVKDRYPLPLIDDHLDSLRGKKFYTCIDLKDGFHHVRVAEHSQKYTSFTTPLGQFSYLRMPFGICNGPSVFQRFVNNIFKDLIKQKRIIV